jgi:hypothetical protein
MKGAIFMGRAKYSVEEKLAWVTRILSNEITPTQAAKMSGINDMAIGQLPAGLHLGTKI